VIDFFSHAKSWKSQDDLLNISKADLGRMRKLELGFPMPELLGNERWGFLLWIDAWLPCFLGVEEISLLVYSEHQSMDPRISAVDSGWERVNEIRARSEQKLEEIRAEKLRNGILWTPPTLIIWNMESETIMGK